MHRKLLLTACLLTATASVASAQGVSLSPDPAVPISFFGSAENGGIQSVGQVFTTGATDSYLTDFSFFLANDTDTDPNSIGSDVKFRAYVYGFDGSATTGSALYTSPVTSGPDATTFQQYLFATGLTPITPNTTYVAFLSTSGIAQNGLGFNAFAGTSDSYGNDLFLDYGDSQLSDPNTTADGGVPMAFSANFASTTTTTPEPSELALLGTGLIGLVPMVRRKLRV